MTTRTAARFANYSGDVTHIVGEIKGPNTWGERMTAVSADYDGAADSTRVGFAFTTTADYPRESA